MQINAFQRVGRRRDPEVAARGLRPHRERGAVEGPAGRRRPLRRHHAADRRRLERLPRRLRRGVRAAHHRAARRSRQAPTRWAQQGREHVREQLPLDPRARGLAAAVRRPRARRSDRRLAPGPVPVLGAATTARSPPDRGAGGVVERARCRCSRDDTGDAHVDRGGDRATTTAPRSQPARADDPGVDLHLLDLDPTLHRLHYDVISNGVLWFLLPRPVRPRPAAACSTAASARRGTAYVAVNEAFADAVADGTPEGEVVLVQDYQLALVPGHAARGCAPTCAIVALHPHAVLRSRPHPGAARPTSPTRCARRWPRCPPGSTPTRWARAYSPSAREVLGRDADDRRPFAAPLGPDADALARAAAAPDGTAAAAAALDDAGRRPPRDPAHRPHRARRRTSCAASSPTTGCSRRARSCAGASCSSRCSTRRARACPSTSRTRNEIEQVVAARQRAVGDARLAAGRRRHARRLRADRRRACSATTCCS